MIVDSLQFLGERLIENKARGPAGSPGFTWPDSSRVRIFSVAEDTKADLRDVGIDVIGAAGTENYIVADLEMRGAGLKIYFNGKNGNTVFLGGPRQNSRGRIWIGGHGNFVIIGQTGVKPFIINGELHSTNSMFFAGPGATAGGLNFHLEGEDNCIHLGDDCQFSWGIWLRTSDTHGIVDLASGDILNSPAAILIEPHVWLGQDVMVMGGVEIGAGSIVGARAVVTRSLPRAVVAVGMPARVVRSEVSWTRAPRPSQAQLDELRSIPLMPTVRNFSV